MAFNYEVKKRVFGFDKTKTEKYVAQMKTLGIIQFGDLCDEVTMSLLPFSMHTTLPCSLPTASLIMSIICLVLPVPFLPMITRIM